MLDQLEIKPMANHSRYVHTMNEKYMRLGQHEIKPAANILNTYYLL